MSIWWSRWGSPWGSWGLRADVWFGWWDMDMLFHNTVPFLTPLHTKADSQRFIPPSRLAPEWRIEWQISTFFCPCTDGWTHKTKLIPIYFVMTRIMKLIVFVCRRAIKNLKNKNLLAVEAREAEVCRWTRWSSKTDVLRVHSKTFNPHKQTLHTGWDSLWCPPPLPWGNTSPDKLINAQNTINNPHMFRWMNLLFSLITWPHIWGMPSGNAAEGGKDSQDVPLGYSRDEGL